MNNNNIKWHYIGGPYGDETSRYELKFNKSYTVQQLIDEILKDVREWGYIGIYTEGTIFGKPVCEYSYGKLITSPLPEKYLNKKIIKCIANGGWTRMDYLIYLKELV